MSSQSRFREELSKNQAILLYVMQKGGPDMGHRKAAKSVLKADIYSINRLGHKITDYQYKAAQLGPYCYAIGDDRDELRDKQFINKVETPSNSLPIDENAAHNIYELNLSDKFNIREYISEEELGLLDLAIDHIIPMTPEEAVEDSHGIMYDSYYNNSNDKDKQEDMPDHCFLEPYKPSEEELAQILNDQIIKKELEEALRNSGL